MGFSLKPPSWLRNIVSKVTGGTVQVVNPLQSSVPPGYQPVEPSGSPDSLPNWLLPAAVAGLGIMLLTRRGSKN